MGARDIVRLSIKPIKAYTHKTVPLLTFLAANKGTTGDSADIIVIGDTLLFMDVNLPSRQNKPADPCCLQL